MDQDILARYAVLQRRSLARGEHEDTDESASAENASGGDAEAEANGDRDDKAEPEDGIREHSSVQPAGQVPTAQDGGTQLLQQTAKWAELRTGKWDPMTLEAIRGAQAEFAIARGWTKFHKPRNIMSALTSEIGELTEAIGLWRDVGFGGDGLTHKEKSHVGEEITDCLVYLLRLADVLDVDLPRAVESKMQKNAAKYPEHLVFGSSKKYTEYTEEALNEDLAPLRP